MRSRVSLLIDPCESSDIPETQRDRLYVTGSKDFGKLRKTCECSTLKSASNLYIRVETLQGWFLKKGDEKRLCCWQMQSLLQMTLPDKSLDTSLGHCHWSEITFCCWTSVCGLSATMPPVISSYFYFLPFYRTILAD